MVKMVDISGTRILMGFIKQLSHHCGAPSGTLWQWEKNGLTMWPPPVLRWFINPMNTLVIGTINHSYWSYVHQLSYRKRGPHFVVMVNDGIFHGENHQQTGDFMGFLGRRPIQMVSHGFQQPIYPLAKLT